VILQLSYILSMSQRYWLVKDKKAILYFQGLNKTTLAQLVVIPTITESSQGRVPDTKLTSTF